MSYYLFGGMGKLEHIKEVNFNTECKAIAIADFSHSK